MLHKNELDSDEHLQAKYLEFLEAYARVCDEASHYNPDLFPSEDEPMKALSVEERILLPLHVKIESTIPALLQHCTNKAFREKFAAPKKDPKVGLFLLGPKKYF